MAALRARLPGTLIGISTGAWIEADPDRTLACIGSWRVPPDYASVNLAEPAAPAVMHALHRRGIGIEAGLASVADAERLAALELGPLCLRALIEIEEQDAADAVAAADAIAATRVRAGLRAPILLHGTDASVWPLVCHAAARGFSTRVGLEDGAALLDGSDAPDNAALVRAAMALLRPPA
jgi:uncharacterized protein (DUF849 family)